MKGYSSFRLFLPFRWARFVHISHLYPPSHTPSRSNNLSVLQYNPCQQIGSYEIPDTDHQQNLLGHSQISTIHCLISAALCPYKTCTPTLILLLSCTLCQTRKAHPFLVTGQAQAPSLCTQTITLQVETKPAEADNNVWSCLGKAEEKQVKNCSSLLGTIIALKQASSTAQVRYWRLREPGGALRRLSPHFCCNQEPGLQEGLTTVTA